MTSYIALLVALVGLAAIGGATYIGSLLVKRDMPLAGAALVIVCAVLAMAPWTGGLR